MAGTSCSNRSHPLVNVWYISFHGGDEPNSLNSIHVYGADGRELRKALNRDSLPPDVELRELRGFAFGPDENLYVVNAYRKHSEILQFAGTLNPNGQHDFIRIYVKGDDAVNPGMLHPFNVAFDVAGDLYVSSQDTGVVSRYYGPKSGRGVPGTPMPVPNALANLRSIPPGTFVPSSKDCASGLVTVRDATFGPDKNLYVADRDTNSVRKYDGQSGQFLDQIVSEHLDKPIHLLFSRDGGSLFCGSAANNSICRYDSRVGKVSVFVEPKSGGLEGPAGMALGEDDYLYVASRTSNQVLRFKSDDATPDKKPFIHGLKDNPEFLMLVDL